MQRQFRCWIGYAAIAVLITSCGGKSSATEGSCSQVATHVGTIVREELNQIEGDEAKTLLSSVPSLTKRIQEKCEQEHWSARLIQCVIDAKDQAAVDQCESLMKQERGPASRDAGVSAEPVQQR